MQYSPATGVIGSIKYSAIDKKQAASEDDGAQAAPDPSQATFTTRADRDGVANTMKRRLAEKVVLLIKTRSNPATAAAAAGPREQLQQHSEWTFPLASHQADESIRETAERALKSAIGPAAVSGVTAPGLALVAPAWA
eukprot:gene1299-1640_t